MPRSPGSSRQSGSSSSSRSRWLREEGEPFKYAFGVCMDASQQFGGSCSCSPGDTEDDESTATFVSVQCKSHNSSATLDETVENGLIVMQVVCDAYHPNGSGDNDNNETATLCVHEFFEATDEGRYAYDQCQVSVNGKMCDGCQKHKSSCADDSRDGFVAQCAEQAPQLVCPQQEALSITKAPPSVLSGGNNNNNDRKGWWDKDNLTKKWPNLFIVVAAAVLALLAVAVVVVVRRRRRNRQQEYDLAARSDEDAAAAAPENIYLDEFGYHDEPPCTPKKKQPMSEIQFAERQPGRSDSSRNII